MTNVCIFWDIENVTPGANSLFVDALAEYAESLGRVIWARAYCDWSKPGYKKLAPQLARLSYYMVHVPRERSQRKSADMQLVSDALETLNMNEHIDTYVLVTGDSDFRPLVLALRRAGKLIHIVCDLRHAAQDLLAVADTFHDFRELLPGGDEEPEEEPRDDRTQPRKPSVVPKEYWYELLAEASSVMNEEGKGPNPGSVKVRMKMLNPSFSEKNLGFKRWGDFVTAAARAGYVVVEEKDEQTLLLPGSKYKDRAGPLRAAFDRLISVLKELDASKAPEFHEFAVVSQRLVKRGFDVKSLGFRQFKAFVQAAETRGLVETEVERLEHLVRRVEEKPQRRRRRKR
jgi:uncharacterized LabA/DUF88 family protein